MTIFYRIIISISSKGMLDILGTVTLTALYIALYTHNICLVQQESGVY